jgi:hypothetical protein
LNGDTSGAGHQLAQEPQPLRPQLCGEKIDTRRVAAWPGEAGDQTELDRILGDTEDDRNRGRCGFGRQRGGLAARCRDDGNAATNQVGRQLRQLINMIFGPAVLDRHVLARYVTRFAEPLTECSYEVGAGRGRTVQKSNRRHCRLLRACGDRPSRRPADCCDELAAFHSITSSAATNSVCGTVRPIALAVLRLMASSNFVGWRTGRSAGLAPLRIRPT